MARVLGLTFGILSKSVRPSILGMLMSVIIMSMSLISLRTPMASMPSSAKKNS